MGERNSKEVVLEDGDESELLKQYHELAELAGSLAHEIKNPLSVINMNADLLSEEISETEWPGKRRAEAKVEIIRQQCQRLEHLLRDFMRYSRLRSLDLTPGSLNEQIDAVLRLFQAQADRDQIEVIRYLDSDLPSVMLHSDSMQASLVNLVKNAMEAMEGGGQLVVRTYTTPRGVALELIDTGCGMEDNTAIHMFEPFYSTKNGGSGLGLPTARKIIQAHGGRISVQSEVGRGTKFVLEFPVPARLG
ncbi:MAG: two-component system sensor histidine kinase NtrB [Aureliella sp.]